MSTYKSISQVIKEIEYWLRLAIVLHGPLKQNLLCVLHNKNNDPSYKGLPEDPSELYKELSTTHKSVINKLVNAKVLKKDQLEILLPTIGDNKTYSEGFDVTLLVVLIINCTTLPPPQDGWYKTPPDSDTGVAANVVRGREWRNFLNHIDANAIDEAAFNLKWTKGIAIIQGLGGSVKDITSLKTISLDPKHELVIKLLMDFNQQEIMKLRSKVDELENTMSIASKQIDENSEKIEENKAEISTRFDQQNELMVADNDVIHNKIDENARQAGQEIEQIYQRFDQQNELMVADNDAIHNKIDENARQTGQEIKQIYQLFDQQNELMVADNDVIHNKIEKTIANHDLMWNQLNNILKEMEKLKTLEKENFMPKNCTGMFFLVSLPNFEKLV